MLDTDSTTDGTPEAVYFYRPAQMRRRPEEFRSGRGIFYMAAAFRVTFDSGWSPQQAGSVLKGSGAARMRVADDIGRKWERHADGCKTRLRGGHS